MYFKEIKAYNLQQQVNYYKENKTIQKCYKKMG